MKIKPTDEPLKHWRNPERGMGAKSTKENKKMKFKVSKKDMKYEEVYSVGYCALQFLLRFEEPTAYSKGAYGWACDYYKVEDAYICTGYNPIGKVADYKMIKKYEAKAEKIITNTAYEKQKTLLSHLLKKLIKELRGK